MLKIKPYLVVFSLALLMSSCSEEATTLEALSLAEDEATTAIVSARMSSSFPFSFDSEFNGDDFQVDNDGNGAHNWDSEEYEEDPIDNGFDVRDFIWVDDGLLNLQCPNGEDDRRRAEYRDQENIDLSDEHRMDFTFDIRDYNNDSELIMAQLHNDNRAARRPFITVVAEEGEIRLQRTNAPTGSSTNTANQRIPFRTNDKYRIRIDSKSGTRSVFVRIINLDTNERAQTTFNFAGLWNELDGDFYWKFGAYMPDGGSTNTRMRVSRINFRGQ